MKALTLTQPYATLISLGQKQIETRSWTSRHRGKLAIHAGTGLGPVGGKRGLRDLCRSEGGASPHFYEVLKPLITSIHGSPIEPAEALPLGAIVAVAHVYDIRRTTKGSGYGWQFADWVSEISYREDAFGDYSAGRYGWMLQNITPLPKPIPCKGALSLWDVPDDIVAQIEAMLSVDKGSLEPARLVTGGTRPAHSDRQLSLEEVWNG